MKMFRLAGVIAGLLLSLLLAGCGDTYRPVITPFPTSTPNPKAQSMVVVANEGFMPGAVHGVPCTPADTCPGSTTDIDVPGDINMANHVVGEGPLSAVLIGAALYTASRNNTVSTYSPFISGSVVNTTSLNPTATVQTNSSTSIPVSIGPSFVATKQGGAVFVAMPACASVSNGACAAKVPGGSVFDNTTPGALGIISTSTNQLTQTIQMDLAPVAMVELADTSKLYVVNQGDGSSKGTVVVLNALNNTILSPTTAATATTPPSFGMPVGVSPVWATATPDSKFVFVLNSGSNTVSVISAANDSAIVGTLPVGTQGPIPAVRSFQNPMVWDNANKRLYVTNPGSNTVSIFDGSNLDVATFTMPLVKTVPLPAATVPPAPPLPAGVQPFSIAVLPDGSRAYVLNAGDVATGGANGPSVSIIDANNLTASQLGSYFGADPRGIVASSDGSKVYVAYHEWTTGTLPDGKTPAPNPIPPGTAVFKTLDNSTIRDSSGAPFPMAAPFQDPVACTTDSATCVRQRPVLVLAQ